MHGQDGGRLLTITAASQHPRQPYGNSLFLYYYYHYSYHWLNKKQ
jgi:hypothetical protein